MPIYAYIYYLFDPFIDSIHSLGTIFSETTYDTIDSFRQSDRGHLFFGVNGAKAQEFRQVDVAQQVQGMGRPLNHHPIPGKTIRDERKVTWDRPEKLFGEIPTEMNFSFVQTASCGSFEKS